jgi:hypothetical protein
MALGGFYGVCYASKRVDWKAPHVGMTIPEDPNLSRLVCHTVGPPEDCCNILSGVDDLISYKVGEVDYILPVYNIQCGWVY